MDSLIDIMTEHEPISKDMMRPKPYGWVIAIVVVAIIAFTGGYFVHQPTATKTVNIQFYESLASSEASYVNNTIIPQFEAQNPNIHVTLVNVGSGAVSTDMLAKEKAGNVGPIVAGQDNLEIGQLIYSQSGNVLMNLTKTESTLMPTDLIPAASGLVNYEKTVFGGVYFFPFRGNVPLVFYNKTTFSTAGITTPPATYAKLVQDASLIKNTTNQNAIMIQGASTSGSHSGSSTATELYQMMVQYGGNPLYLNDSGDIHAVQELYNMSPYFSQSFSNGYWGSYNGLAVGNYSILDYQWPYIYNTLTQTPYSMTNTTLGFYPGPAGPVNSNHILGGDVLFIPKGASHVSDLETFIHFLLSAKPQQEMLLNLSWVAINNDAYSNLPANEQAIDAALGQAIKDGVFLRNPTPWITDWQTIFDNVVFNPLFVDHTSHYSNIPTLLSNAHAQMYSYIQAHDGQANATLYQSNSSYAPIIV